MKQISFILIGTSNARKIRVDDLSPCQDLLNYFNKIKSNRTSSLSWHFSDILYDSTLLETGGLPKSWSTPAYRGSLLLNRHMHTWLIKLILAQRLRMLNSECHLQQPLLSARKIPNQNSDSCTSNNWRIRIVGSIGQTNTKKYSLESVQGEVLGTDESKKREPWAQPTISPEFYLSNVLSL